MLLLDSGENPKTGPYQLNLQFPQDKTQSRSNLWVKNRRKREVVRGGQGPRIGWRGEKQCSREINYNHHLSLIQTLPTSSTRSPPQPHINDPISNSGCKGHYLDALTTLVHTREPSENPINVKLPNSSTIASTHQSQIPLKHLSSQAKHAEIFPNLHSSLISIVT